MSKSSCGRDPLSVDIQWGGVQPCPYRSQVFGLKDCHSLRLLGGKALPKDGELEESEERTQRFKGGVNHSY